MLSDLTGHSMSIFLNVICFHNTFIQRLFCIISHKKIIAFLCTRNEEKIKNICSESKNNTKFELIDKTTQFSDWLTKVSHRANGYYNWEWSHESECRMFCVFIGRLNWVLVEMLCFCLHNWKSERWWEQNQETDIHEIVDMTSEQTISCELMTIAK